MYLIRGMTNLPVVEIGKVFDNRDHSTVLYSLKQVEKQMKKDPAFAGFRLGGGAVCREFEIAQNSVLAGGRAESACIARFWENRTFWTRDLIWVYTHSPEREHRQAAFQCGRFPFARCEPFFL